MKEFLGSKGVTAAELERTVNGSTRELPGSFETSGDVLTEMQRDVLYERPFDYVEGLADKYRALTAKDLDSAARAAIDPDAFTWVAVGDKNKVIGQLQTLGMHNTAVEAPACRTRGSQKGMGQKEKMKEKRERDL